MKGDPIFAERLLGKDAQRRATSSPRSLRTVLGHPCDECWANSAGLIQNGTRGSRYRTQYNYKHYFEVR